MTATLPQLQASPATELGTVFVKADVRKSGLASAGGPLCRDDDVMARPQIRAIDEPAAAESQISRQESPQIIKHEQQLSAVIALPLHAATSS